MRTKPFIRLALIGVLGSLVFDVRAEFVVSPSFSNPTDANAWPFFYTSQDAPSFRYQEWRSASDFSSLGSPLLITEFSLWRHPGSLPIDFVLPSVVINFSTTPRTPSSFGSVFADNIGADETTVFSGPLHLVDSGGPYGIRIPLQTPFLYDPAAGNFLMDFRIYQTVPEPGPGGYFVYFSRTATTVRLANAIGADADSASGVGNGGVFTRFSVTPVPEPSTWVLLATVMAALAFARRPRNKNHCTNFRR